MGMYDDLLVAAQPGGVLEKFTKIDLSISAKLQELYPELPVDFLSFLEEVGSGELGNAAYIIYNGVLEPNEIYDQITAEGLKNILIFGDDMQGYCSGFDINNGWFIVEINPTDMSYRRTFDKFSDFIRDKLKGV